jgi:hypothetical protein
MTHKKTEYMIVLILLEVISIFGSIAGMLFEFSMEKSMLGYANAMLSALGIFVGLIWLHRMWFLKRDLVKWTHIHFGFSILASLLLSLGLYFETRAEVSLPVINILTISVITIIWITFVKHIKKAIETHRIELH